MAMGASILARVRALPRPVRVASGVLLVCGGILGFLPILGFWMVPLGLVVLSLDSPWVLRGLRRTRVRIGRRVQRWRARRTNQG